MSEDLAIALGTTTLMFGAAIGAGASLMAITRTLARMTRLEAAAWSFALGFGALGWLTFFLGWASALHGTSLGVLSGVLAMGIALLRGAPRTPTSESKGKTFWILCLVLAVVVAIDFVEALSPPADADSLAYHFALPKQFLAAGRIEFVPRAVDGAIPLLMQMTYVIALAMGGEMALTLWCALSGWMAGLLTYTLARRHLDASWSLVIALLFLSVPAVIVSGGTGQVEVRAALFAAVAAAALGRGTLERHLGFIVVAALAAGFFAASKYTGLLYGAACGIALLLLWPSRRSLTAFSLVALLAGMQWYGWNWWHTGDPVFPTLFGVLGLPDGPYWTAAQDVLFRSVYFKVENPLPIDPWQLLAYPVIATLFGPAAIESGRTGLGPWGLLVLPFALGGLWRFRQRLWESPLLSLAIIVIAFYILWFVTGSSQRVRHLVPILPLFLVLTAVAAVRWVDIYRLQRPLAAAVMLTLTSHIAVQVVFGLNYAHHFLSRESREAFLTRNVPNYGLVASVEAATTAQDRILVDQRQLIYLFDRDVFYYHMLDQAQISLGVAGDDPEKAFRQLRTQGITHVLARTDGTLDLTSVAGAMDILVERGCAIRSRELIGAAFSSRTLSGDHAMRVPAILFRLKDEGCRLVP